MKKIFWGAMIVALLLIAYISIPFLANIMNCNDKDIMKKNYEMLIVAHRGGAGMAPENSLLCIEKGIQVGADMVEIDIHMTRDGELVVCHDQTIDRTTTGTGRIADMALDEIRQYYLVDKLGKATKERIPTLKEVLELVNGRCDLLIEIKRTEDIYQGIEQKLLDLIQAYHASEWTVVQSFNDSVLETLYALNKTVRLEKLVVFKFPWLPIIFDGTFTNFNFEKYHYISSFNFYYKAMTLNLLKKIHKEGKEVKVWTLEEPEKWKSYPVNGIITDRPDLWVKKK